MEPIPTKEENKQAQSWWRELSINEMDNFVTKYYPAFYRNDLPRSFVTHIHKKYMKDSLTNP